MLGKKGSKKIEMEMKLNKYPKKMNNGLSWPIAAIYVAFFGLIGFATYYTGNANCLWALLLTPSYDGKS